MNGSDTNTSTASFIAKIGSDTSVDQLYKMVPFTN